MTRAVVGNISLSLDGRVNGPGGEYDMGWIVPHAVTDMARDRLVAMISTATTALLGRTNYEGFRSYWPAVAGDEHADPRDREFSRWLDATQKIIFSRTQRETAWQNARITDRSPHDVVAELRDIEGGDILVLSSASIIRSLLAADALDRLRITLCPVVAGGGARLFDESLPPATWRLLESVVMERGALSLVYERA